MPHPVRPFRLFLGIPVSAPQADQLAGVRFRSNCIRWQSPDAYHITLKYLGAYETEDKALALVPGVHDALAGFWAVPVEACVTGIGVFEDSSVLFAEVELSPSLKRLHGQITAACEGLGPANQFPVYHPHITLGKYWALGSTEFQMFGDQLERLLVDSQPLAIYASRVKLVMTALRRNEERPGYRKDYTELGCWQLNAVTADA